MIIDPDFIPRALDRWRQETINISSPRTYMKNNWCRFLIYIGTENKNEVVPILISEIDRNPDRVSLILRAVTKEDPTKRKSRGDWKKLGEDWKSWWADRLRKPELPLCEERPAFAVHCRTHQCGTLYCGRCKKGWCLECGDSPHKKGRKSEDQS